MTVGKKYEEVHFVDTSLTVWNYSLFTDEDVRNFQNGTLYQVPMNYSGHMIYRCWIRKDIILPYGRPMPLVLLLLENLITGSVCT